MLRKKINGVWNAISDVKKKTGGAWADCGLVRKKEAGAWYYIWRRYTYSQWYIKSSSWTSALGGFDTCKATFVENGPITINLVQSDFSELGEYGTDGYVYNLIYHYSSINVKPGESIYFDYSCTTNYPTNSDRYGFSVGVAAQINNDGSTTPGVGRAVGLTPNSSGVAKLTNTSGSTWYLYMYIKMSLTYNEYASRFTATITINKIYTDSERVVWPNVTRG